jgi:lactoylglutathione lyase
MSDRVHELRLVVTAEDYDDALHFYRDVLGCPSVRSSSRREEAA